MNRLTREHCLALDRADPLRPFRELFDLPERIIYLDGNSLGPLPRATAARLQRVTAEEWGQGLIRSWNTHGWIDLPSRVGDKIGRLIGGAPGSTLVADSTSINLFKLLAAALQLRPERQVILTEADNFPTDIYIAQGLADLLGRGHRIRRAQAGAIAEALDDSVAVLLLTQVNYLTGEMHDIDALTWRAHEAGALVLWDLSHSAGALPIDLAACDADLAVGCGYKFLNGGPGAPAFVYAAPRLHERLRMPLTGWLGHAEPFAFEPEFRPASGILRAAAGTPPILGLSALEEGLDVALAAPIEQLREKSLHLGALFARLIEQECAGHGFRIVTPMNGALRGSQVSVAHPEGHAIMQALISPGVIGDFRPPDIMRFGITPLYLGYAELWDAAQCLSRIMRAGTWREPRFRLRGKVT